jgi:RHS repeat-associated protein
MRLFSVGAVTVLLLASLSILVYYPPFVRADAPPEGGGGNTGWQPFYYYVGGLVQSSNGNLIVRQDDAFVDARGPDLGFARSYNSLHASTDGPLGYGWTSNLHSHLDEAGSGNVTWYDPTDTPFLFAIDGSDYLSPAGVSSELVKSAGLFTLAHKDGSIWSFNSDLNLDTVADKNGNELTFSWSGDSPPKLLNVSDDSGLVLALSYSGAQISSITFPPDDRTVSFSYSSGDLINATDASGNVTKFTYSSHKIDTWTDPVGKRLSFAYDGSDRVSFANLSAIDLGTGDTLYEHRAYSFSYDGAWTNVTNARSKVTAIDHNAAGNALSISGPQCGACGAFQLVGGGPTTSCGCAAGPGSCGSSTDGFREVSQTVTMTWDANDDLLTYADAGAHQWNLSWDASRNLLNLTDPLGNLKRWNWTNQDNGSGFISLMDNSTDFIGNKWEYTYGAAGNLNMTTDPYGNYSERHYDAYGFENYLGDFRGNVTTRIYDNHGYLINASGAIGTTVLYSRDAVGRLANQTSPRGYVWNYSYDPMDRLTNVTDPYGASTLYSYNARGDRTSGRDPLGHFTNMTFNITVGKIDSVTDARGNVTTYGYDDVGNLVSVMDRSGAQTTSSFDDWNRPTMTTDGGGNQTVVAYNVDGTIHNRTDRRGSVTTYVHDAKHQMTNVTDAMSHSTTYSYDRNGRTTSTTDPLNHSWWYSFDALGRLIASTDPAGSIATRSYDANGNLVNWTDANGFSTLYGYDQLNRRVNTTNPLGYLTIWTFTATSRIATQIDQGGNLTIYAFDNLDRLTNITDAVGGLTSYTYDAVGNVVSVEDAGHHKTNRTYDGLNRLASETTALGNIATYTYDEEGRVTNAVDAKSQSINYSYDQQGRLLRADYPLGVTNTYRYDAEGSRYNATVGTLSRNDTLDGLGRVTSSTYHYTTFDKKVDYAYDAAGNRVGMSYPDGKWLNGTFDSLNRPSTLVFDHYAQWNFSFDAGSRLTILTLPTGGTTVFQYNAAGWVSAYYTNSSLGAPLDSATYTFDRQGNRASITNEASVVGTFTYDQVYRLLTEDYSNTGGPAPDRTYTYDTAGNRVTEKVLTSPPVTSTYDAENRLTSVGASVYTYDSNGNEAVSTLGGVTTFEWEATNQITKVTLPNATFIQYDYTTDGQRISRSQQGGPKTYYGYDFQGAGGFEDLIAEYNSAGSMTARHVAGPGIDQPLAKIVISGNATYYYTFDSLGSVQRLLTTTQVENTKYEYFGFGAARSTTAGIANPYQFTARELDATTGLYNYRARTYDTGTGRFTSKDPEGMLDGPNVYTYVKDNPVNKVDPSGEHACAWWEWIVWGSLWCTTHHTDWGCVLNCMISGGPFNNAVFNWCWFTSGAVCWRFPNAGCAYAFAACLGIGIGVCITRCTPRF